MPLQVELEKVQYLLDLLEPLNHTLSWSGLPTPPDQGLFGTEGLGLQHQFPAFALGKDDVLQLTAGAKANLWAFNDAQQDRDDDDALFAPKGANAVGLLDPASLAARPCLALKLEGHVKGKVILSGLGLDGETSCHLADYRRFDADTTVLAAAKTLFTHPRSILDTGTVNALGEGEALVLRRTGALKFQATLELSDVWSFGLKGLQPVLGLTPVLRLPAEGTFKVGVSVEGEFRLAMYRRNDDLHFQVHRVSRRASTVDAALKVGLSLDPATQMALKEALDGLLQRSFGATLEELGKLQAHLDGDNLPDQWKPIYQKVLDVLGWEDEAQTPARLSERIQEWRDKLAKAFEGAVSTKLQFAVQAEVGRFTEQEALAVGAIQSGAALAEATHEALVRLDFAALHEAAEVKWKECWVQDVQTRQRSLGFSLAIGRWAASSKDHSSLTIRDKKDLNGRHLLALAGVREYQSVWGKDKETYTLDTRADMAAFRATPCGDDFDFGMHLRWQKILKHPAKADLERFLDTALIWKAADQAGVDRVLGAFGSSTELTLTADLKVIRGLRDLCHHLGQVPVDQRKRQWGRWCAMATLPSAMTANPGKTLSERQRLRELAYGPAWEARFHLAQPLTPKQMGDLVYQSLGKLIPQLQDYPSDDLNEWRQVEKSQVQAQSTLAGCAALNPMDTQWGSGVQALLGIGTFSGTHPLSPKNLATTLANVHCFGTHLLAFRALGCALAECAKEVGADVAATVTIQSGEQSWLLTRA